MHPSSDDELFAAESDSATGSPVAEGENWTIVEVRKETPKAPLGAAAGGGDWAIEKARREETKIKCTCMIELVVQE
jgi:hypothetical protein